MESSQKLYYENAQELKNLLTSYFIGLNPLDKLYHLKCLSNDRDKVLLEWMSRPDLQNRFVLYPPKFRCLIHAVLMSSRTLTKSKDVDDETFKKLEFLSESRLNSPEIYVNSPEKVQNYSYPTEESEFKSQLCDMLTSEVDNMLDDSTCFGNYYAFLGDSKEAVAAGMISDCFLAPHLMSLISENTALEILYGIVLLSSVRDIINTILIQNPDMFYCDKYIFLTKAYKSTVDYDLKPLMSLTERMRKYNIIK